MPEHHSTRQRARRVRRPWGTLRVWTAGAGSPLLAVHGLGGSGRYWQGLADRVGGRFRVVAPDLAGFGGSGSPAGVTDRAHHLADLDAVIDSVIDEGGVEHDGGNLTIVGHSLGAVLGALAAGRHAARIRTLAIVAAPWPGDVRSDEQAPQRRPLSVSWQLAGSALRTVAPALAVPVGVARGYPAAVATDFARQSLRARAWTRWSVLSDPRVADELRSLERCGLDRRVLLLHARDDRRVPLAAQRRWAELFPGAAREVVAAGGHQFLLSSVRPLSDPLLDGR